MLQYIFTIIIMCKDYLELPTKKPQSDNLHKHDIIMIIMVINSLNLYLELNMYSLTLHIYNLYRMVLV